MPADGALVNARERRADRRRPHHAPVQHARHAHVVRVVEARGRKRRHVDARNRAAENRPVAARGFLFAFFLIVISKCLPPISSP